MIVLYTKQNTARLEYTAKHIFGTLLQTAWRITTNRDDFIQYEGVKINYSNDDLGGVRIVPSQLLFDTSIEILDIQCDTYQDIPVLFPVEQSAALPFDPFSAIFFMISRYEEYWPHEADIHGRYQHKSSVAWKNSFLEIPVVEHWVNFLKESITQKYPDFIVPERKYCFLPTIDVDIAWAFLHRNFFRTLAASMLSLLSGDFKNLKQRIRVLFRNEDDPYDTFGWMQLLHAERHLEPIFFYQVGNYGKWDKNISGHHLAMKRLITNTSFINPVGIHPSYQSHGKIDTMKNEIELLQSIIEKPVKRSRQHYLLLNLPSTYRNLINLGVTEDYTMGYAGHIGFRAGTCTPFLFFDLQANVETELKIIPFQVMDTTLRYYQNIRPLEAIDKIDKIISEVKKVNGTFVSLWHNTSLSERYEWHHWREVYQNLLRIA